MSPTSFGIATPPSQVDYREILRIGRDPAAITRSIALPVLYGQPDEVRRAIAEATEAGFRQVILTLPAPYPDHVARWVADELIAPTASPPP